MLDFGIHEHGNVCAAETIVEYIAADPAVEDEFLELTALLRARVALPTEVFPVPQWPLALHRHYSRREIVAAVGYVKPGEKGRTPQQGIRPPHAGDRPIGITWTLDHPMPLAHFERYARLAQR